MSVASESPKRVNAPARLPIQLNDEPDGRAQLRHLKPGNSDANVSERDCQIALLTPYSGNNFGDAAIVDATIGQLRARIPGARFSGITLDCENFTERHGDKAFPLCAGIRPFYTAGAKRPLGPAAPEGMSASHQGWIRRSTGRLVHKVPGLVRALKAISWLAREIEFELLHAVQGYRFLHSHDLLIIAGGGQLDEEWGGPWGHPFALFKWSALARIAHVRCEFVSVGASKVDSRISQMFLSMALRMSQGRSYRDEHTREIAARLLPRAARDSVVPDIAFGAPRVDSMPSSAIRSAAKGRTVIAVSPISYARPGSWPHGDPAFYRHYLDQMSRLIEQLIDRDYFVVMVFSALSDANVNKEISSSLDERLHEALPGQIHIPSIGTWRDLVRLLQDVDIVIASRLHSAILSFVANKPTIAISFDKKVDRIMEDLSQTDYLLQIRDFSAEDIIEALCRIEKNRSSVAEGIESYTQQARRVLESQFDSIAHRAQDIRLRAG